MTVTLETERLVLRPLEPQDVDMHYALMSDPAVARFLSLDHKPPSRAMAWRAFATMLGHWTIRGFGFFAVIEKASGDCVGRVGPWFPEGWPQIEVGWGVVPAHWGKGYAPEAAIAAVDWTFRLRPELNRIISVIDPENVNSQAVARKIGEARTDATFTLEGAVLDVWAVTRSQWEMRGLA